MKAIPPFGQMNVNNHHAPQTLVMLLGPSHISMGDSNCALPVSELDRHVQLYSSSISS